MPEDVDNKIAVSVLGAANDVLCIIDGIAGYKTIGQNYKLALKEKSGQASVLFLMGGWLTVPMVK